jgi:hypothetical protein
VGRGVDRDDAVSAFTGDVNDLAIGPHANPFRFLADRRRGANLAARHVDHRHAGRLLVRDVERFFVGRQRERLGVLAALEHPRDGHRAEIDDADAVRLAIARRQLGLVDARARDRRAGQRDEHMLAVVQDANTAWPLAHRQAAHDRAGDGIDDDQPPARFVRHVDARPGRRGFG